MNTMRATTLRRNLTIGAALAAALFASQTPAATMEEVVARGTNSVAAAQRAHFEAEMASYVRAVTMELRDSVRENLAQSGAPKLRLAQRTGLNRG